MVEKLPALQFYPGDWRGSKWVTLNPENLSDIPRLPACYVIYLDNKLSYIGQSANVYKRFYNYGIGPTRYSNYGSQTPWGRVRQITVKFRFSTRYGDWAMRELRLIHRLRPPLNCVGSSRHRGQKIDGEEKVAE